MRVQWWGVRGSVPVPGQHTVAFGGNTSCVSVEFGEHIVIFDAGTGILNCGNHLLARGSGIEAAVFISHTHWDHIQGFPFFAPSYIAGNRFVVCGPSSDVGGQTIRQTMELQTKYEHFPIRISQLAATIDYAECDEMKAAPIGAEVTACRLNHPVVCMAYKLVYQGKVFVYGGDHEPYRNVYRDSADVGSMDEELLVELDRNVEEQNRKIVEFCRGADLVSWDAQYTAEEYRSRVGWGHSWYEADMDLAERAQVKHIVFTHHDPARRDEELAELERRYRGEARARGFEVSFAREGMEIVL